jgi:hypothetical protein
VICAYSSDTPETGEALQAFQHETAAECEEEEKRKHTTEGGEEGSQALKKERKNVLLHPSIEGDGTGGGGGMNFAWFLDQ